MKLLAALACVVAALAQPTEVADLTKQYGEAMAAEDHNKIMEFLSESSIISFSSELPFGGTYSKDNMTLMMKRFESTIEEAEMTQKVIAVDEAKGTALLTTTSKGTLVRNDSPITLSLFHVLLWNPVDKTLISHKIVDRNAGDTAEAYRTLAEKKLWTILWATYNSDYDDLLDKTSPVYDLIHDQIQVKINMYPGDILAKTAYEGKDDVIEGFEDWVAMKMKSPMYQLYKKWTPALKTMQVLFADDKEVFVSWYNGKVFAHYTFEDGEDGKMIAEEVLLSKTVLPWQIHPFPMPVESDTDESEAMGAPFDRRQADEDDEDDDDMNLKKKQRRQASGNDDEDDDDDMNLKKKQRRQASGNDDEDDDDDERRFVLQGEDDEDDN